MTTRLEARGSTLGTGESSLVVQLSRCCLVRKCSRAPSAELRLRKTVPSMLARGKLAAAAGTGPVRLGDDGLRPPRLAALDVGPAIKELQLLPGRGGLEAAARKASRANGVISSPKSQSSLRARLALSPNACNAPPTLARARNAALFGSCPLLPASDGPTLQDPHKRRGPGSWLFQADGPRPGALDAEPECRESRSLLPRSKHYVGERECLG